VGDTMAVACILAHRGHEPAIVDGDLDQNHDNGDRRKRRRWNGEMRTKMALHGVALVDEPSLHLRNHREDQHGGQGHGYATQDGFHLLDLGHGAQTPRVNV